MNELRLVEGSKEERDQFIDRTEVLARVKRLNTLAGSEYMTTKQTSEFYGVPVSTIRNIYNDHREEFTNDGIMRLKGKEILRKVSASGYPTSIKQGYTVVDGEKLANSLNNLFSKRAVLRIGMLLRDSEVAKEVRTLLLNVYHDVEQGKENIIENINKDYEDEERLQKELAEAFMGGDMENFSMAAVKITNLLNKRIKELKPKADYTDEVLKSEGLLTTTQIAKDYGMSARALNGILHGLGVQYKQSGQWLLYSSYQDKGYTSSVTFLLDDKSITNTKWTQKGRKFIHDLLKKEGVI